MEYRSYNGVIMFFKKLILSCLLLIAICAPFGQAQASKPKIPYDEGVPTTSYNACTEIKKTGTGEVVKPLYCSTGTGLAGGSFREEVKLIVERITNILYVLAPSVAVIAIIIGAFNIMQNAFSVGVKIIQWALIGMVVVLLSSALISLVVRLLL